MTIWGKFKSRRSSQSSVPRVSNIHSSKFREGPKFSLVAQEYMNFFYCDVPKKKKTYPWKFSLFTDTMDHWTWMLLLLSFSCVAFILTCQNFHSTKIETADMLQTLISATLQM